MRTALPGRLCFVRNNCPSARPRQRLRRPSLRYGPTGDKPCALAPPEGVGTKGVPTQSTACGASNKGLGKAEAQIACISNL